MAKKFDHTLKYVCFEVKTEPPEFISHTGRNQTLEEALRGYREYKVIHIESMPGDHKNERIYFVVMEYEGVEEEV